MQFLFGAEENRLRNVLISIGMACRFFSAIWVNVGSAVVSLLGKKRGVGS
jgi:hypothetical protein